jgi:NlpC/P60 family putative phage cell wall peptidase
VKRLIAPQSIIAEARSWCGTPYHHQSRLKHVGCDCLGLIIGVWEALCDKSFDRKLSYARDWAETADDEFFASSLLDYCDQVDLNAIAPADIILFRWRPTSIAKHAAILTSPTSFIHAHERAGVCEVYLSQWWRRRLAYVFRFHRAD